LSVLILGSQGNNKHKFLSLLLHQGTHGSVLLCTTVVVHIRNAPEIFIFQWENEFYKL